MSVVPGEMKWLSKVSVFRVPLFGWMMRMVGDIPLYRGDRDSASGAMKRARVYLDRGMSVMIFPEGTRSADGQVAAFKNGAFRLAIESGRPVLPIVISGSRDAIPKTSWIFGGRCEVRVDILPPVPTKQLMLEDVDTLRDHVHAEICAGFERLRRKDSL
jgi:1-acyl-sn-glycerol-3-phosphate acyltransferase